MDIADVADLIKYSPVRHVRTVLKEHGKYKVLAIGLEPGQEIPPCVMDSETVFYVAQGSGRRTVDQETADVAAGQAAFVPPGARSSVSCSDRLLLLAIHVH